MTFLLMCDEENNLLYLPSSLLFLLLFLCFSGFKFLIQFFFVAWRNTLRIYLNRWAVLNFPSSEKTFALLLRYQDAFPECQIFTDSFLLLFCFCLVLVLLSFCALQTSPTVFWSLCQDHSCSNCLHSHCIIKASGLWKRMIHCNRWLRLFKQTDKPSF